jgi:hypothetical protein
VTREIAVGDHGDQLASGGQPVQRLAQVLAGHALDAVGGGHHAVQAAEIGDPLGGGLGAHLVHTRHVVHHVADQRQVVDDALGRHAELGLHAFHIQLLGRLGHRVDQRHLGRDELRQILVAGGDQHLVATGRGHAGQRADGVVGFDARHFQHRPAQQAHDFVDGLDLLAQRVGHGGALGLVFGVPGIAEGGALGVEDAGRVFGRKALAQPLHHGHDAVDGPGRKAVGRPQVGHGVVGAVQVAGAVHQQQGLLAHPAIVACRARRAAHP